MKYLKNSISTLFKFPKFLFWGLFLCLILLRFHPFLLGKTLIFGDNYSLMVPGKIFTAQWLREGVLPLWNPYLFSGMPWLADVNQSVLYPSSLLFVIFSPPAAVNLLLVSHAFLAYSGMYLLTKKFLKSGVESVAKKLKPSKQLELWALLAGGLWMLSTQISGSMNNFSTIQSMVWLPWLAWLGLGIRAHKNKFWLGVVVLLQFWGGYPQHVLYGLLGAVLLSALRKDEAFSWLCWLGAWLQSAVWVLGISAIAWIPFLEMLLASTRMEQTLSQAVVGSLHPLMLIKFILPYFFDNPQLGMKWGPAWSGQPNVGIYLSWLGLLALGVSLIRLLKNRVVPQRQREIAFFAVFTLLSLIFSLGQYLPGFSLIQLLIPLFKIARYPSMIMILTNLIMILWVIQGLSTWKLTQKSFRIWVLLGGLSLTLSGLSWLGWRLNFTWIWTQLDQVLGLSSSQFHTLSRDRVIVGQILSNLMINSAFFLASIYLLWRQKHWWLVLVLLVEVLVNTQGLFYFAPKQIYETQNQLAQEVRAPIKLDSAQLGRDSLASGFQTRVLTRNSNTPYTDYGSYWEAMVVRAPFSDSFVDEVELREFNHPQNLKTGLTPNWNIVFQVPMIHGYTTLLPQDYARLWQTSDQPRINFIDRIELSNPLLSEWAVGYYLVDTWFEVKEDLSKYELVAELGEKMGQPGRWRVYQLPALPRFRFEDGLGVELENFTENPNQISFALENSAAHSELIVADRYDKNWEVSVNGQEVELENYQGMRKIPLQPGLNKVKLVYVPRAFYWGVVISSLTLVGFGLYKKLGAHREP